MENEHIYIIIKVLHTDEKQELSSLEEELGHCILNSKPALWRAFLEGKAGHYRRLLRQMEASIAAMNSDKYKELKKLLGQVDGLIDKSV